MIDNRTGLDVGLSEVLQSHAVIDASAGTGKTWTIERLVLRILLDFPAVDLSQILLVTFTEKATGELRQRIRSHLEEQLTALEGEPRAKIASALENFDAASIFTIHGFCNRVVNEFAFENARPLELEKGSDNSLFQRLAARIVREDWPAAPSVVAAQAAGSMGAIGAISGGLRPGVTMDPDYCGDVRDCRDWRDLISWSVHRHRELAVAESRRSSTVSFDRMISDVRAAVSTAGMPNHALLAILRARYRFALVDEFQDTDEEQWEIFRSIFVDGHGDNRLIVVGDPKQAIYGFRGADVLTYIRASEELCSAANGGRSFRLLHNYRSLPSLIGGFNHMFGDGGWFRQVEGNPIVIGHLDSQAPSPASESAAALLADRSGRAPVVAVHLATDEQRARHAGLEITRKAMIAAGMKAKGPECRSIAAAMAELEMSVGEAGGIWREFIAREIEYLVGGSGIVVRDPESGKARSLDYGDICILYRRTPEDRELMRTLRAWGIPFSIYKGRGLYKSAEATNLMILLKGLEVEDAASARTATGKARLSRFFVAGSEGADAPFIADRKQFDQVMAGWRDLCLARRWPEFFDSILHSTGLLLREAACDDGGRRITNWRQMAFELSSAADSGSMSLDALVAFMERKRLGDDDDPDSDLQRIETERPAVQIMTMHACKGLQFPIVFCHSGLSEPSARDRGFVRCYRDMHRHYEITRSADKLPEGCFVDDDASRLFYVAMTRARFKLYFVTGWLPRSPRRPPVLTFMKNGWLNLKGKGGAGEVWTTIDPDGNVLEGRAPDLMTAWDGESVTPLAVPDLPDLSPMRPVNWDMRRQWVDSYSSLHIEKKRRRYRQAESAEGVRDRRSDDSPVQDEDSKSLLSHGAVTGSAFHEVMEAISCRTGVGAVNVDFTDLAGIEDIGKVLDSGIGVLIERKMKELRIPDRQKLDAAGNVVDSARARFARMVVDALRTPLGPSGPLGFRMCDVPSAHTLAEMEFHLDESLFPGFPAWRTGLLNGLIDLIFQHDGRYWFLDWKTTTPDAAMGGTGSVENDPYSPASIDATMKEHGYDAQAGIYSVALLQWLRQCFGDDAESMFGGGIFLFVRGMDRVGRGVWTCDPTRRPGGIVECAAEVGVLLKESADRASAGEVWK